MEPIGTSIVDRHGPTAPVTRRPDRTASGAHAAIERTSDATRPTVDRIAGQAHCAVRWLIGHR
jgi:hypothetical protein